MRTDPASVTRCHAFQPIAIRATRKPISAEFSEKDHADKDAHTAPCCNALSRVTARDSDPADVVVITLQDDPQHHQGNTFARRLAMFLKSALRGYGLRCIDVRPAGKSDIDTDVEVIHRSASVVSAGIAVDDARREGQR